ncbi:hypothetical protein [Bradyrhizobium sp. 150]|uniref:hypothetical protein n=1 Tax=Bradyrhizobium sp. 150 TaxID=2782625 RepID=UPI001FF8C214|nr:hypothetical protein [Bradyrhizobium sp. 150]MCK1670405.1 tail fiber protein [Bradyrhizobium sp. 150]
MSDPKTYDPDYSFSGFQASSPATPLPATKLDAELSGISAAITDHAAAIENVRRSDGALKNNIVTYDSLSKSLQLTFDPTNGEAVAAAIAIAQAAATAASGSATSAGTSATNAAASAAAAATSAGSVNLALFLTKAGNLAGMGNNDTALSNINAMKRDGTNAQGRLAVSADYSVADWNTAIASGYYSASPGAANAPDSANYWLVHVMAADTDRTWITQIAYQFAAAATSTDSVLVYRRFSYSVSGTRVWTPWISNGVVPVGTTIWVNGTTAPPGYVKENGALLLRASYPGLWSFASSGATNNIVTEAAWASGSQGAFSTGDLSTTFRIPDARGGFIRAWDDGRGLDSGRVIGTFQADLLKDHTHNGNNNSSLPNQTGGGSLALDTGHSTVATGGVNGGLGGSETRPKNFAKLACIKF